MSGKLGKGAKITISVVSVIIIFVAVFMGILLGTNLIQKAVIRMMCPDKPGSTPENYEDIVAQTTLETFQYKAGLELDVIEPKDGIGSGNPTVLVFHGGYYVGGGRKNQEPYARFMASHGYRVVNVSYTLAPDGVYPRQLQDANDALNFVADKYVNDNFVVSGDSAGAHLASQLAALVTDSNLRNAVKISNTLNAERLVGVVGNCGFYQATTVEETGFFLIGSGMEILMGDSKFREKDTIKQLDVVSYVANYPSTLLICGDKDAFLSQAKTMEKALKDAGRAVTTYFPSTVDNELGHEFQCNYNLAESYTAMEKIIEFLSSLNN